MGSVAAIVVVVAAVFALSFWGSIPSAKDTAAQADALDAQAKYQDAYNKLQHAYSYGWAFSTSDKALLLSRLAATKYDMGDYPQALKYYQQMDQLQPHNVATLVTMGDLAVQMGDKATAIKAYNEAIPLMQAGHAGPTTAANIARLKQQVAEMQK